MSTAIEVVDLVRVYGKNRAVDGVSFTVSSGEVFGFLGPNGAGKTTTVRMLTTLLEPTAGRVLVGGFDVQRQAYQARRQIGLVPEESNIYTELSAWDNLMFSGRLYRVGRGTRESRAAELLEVFDLQDRRDGKTQSFSKGMRRRLTIAMALMHRPKILFLDEPTSGLDVRSAQAIKGIVRDLNDNGTTVFLTTHQIEEANQLCDRVAIINHGKLAAIDSPERLKAAMQRVQAIEVAFEHSTPALEAALAKLDGVSQVVRQGDKWRLYTADPPSLLPLIFDYAREQGLRIMTLNTLGPSLEDVFLHITGQPVGMSSADDSDQMKRGPKRGQGQGGRRNG